jgi:hypothetical protein
MLDRQGLFNMLRLTVEEKAPTIAIYSEIKSERMNYASRFIFNHVLNLNYFITNNVLEFESYDGFKINYSKNGGLNSSFYVSPAGLLSEIGVSENKPVPFFKKDLIYFYPTKASLSNLDFDVFSSVFYFISRYEEWQAFEPDKHRRFEAKSSLLFQNSFHLKPVVDFWILEFKQALRVFYPTLQFPQKTFKAISTIDVDNLYAFKSKGFLRTIGAAFKDILKFDFINFKTRIKVLSGQEKDPFDIYEDISQFCLDTHVPLFYFFLFRSGTTYDRTVNPHSVSFTKVFNQIKKKAATIGLHPSYNAAYENGLLQKEIEDFSRQLSQSVNFSRQHFLRFNIKSTPTFLQELGILADFSMGFASAPGFRAGTSNPFCYYDFSVEKETDFLFVPFCAMDGAYFVYDAISPEDAFQSLHNLALEIKKVEGLFISVFHERTFSDHLYKGFGTLYKNLHLKLRELQSLKN